MSDDFTWDDVPPPAAKTDKIAPTQLTKQWAASDANFVFDALTSLRSALTTGGVINVKLYGAVGDGTANDTDAIQAAIAANPGRTLYFPKGKYKVLTTLFVTQGTNHWVGDFGVRNVTKGTEIQFYGTGPCVQLGTDNGHAWDASEYDGLQNHVIQNLAFTHVSPDTALAATGGSSLVYKAGSTGIWDWRGGSVVIERCSFAGFEQAFAGIQSDFTRIIDCVIQNSKYGFYFGPRSDQGFIANLNAFFCDRAVTLDRAGQTVIQACSFAFCGTDVASGIEVRKGTHGTVIRDCWFEKSGVGFSSSTDSTSLISVGEVNGYGSGGSIASPGGTPTTASVNGCSIVNPHTYTTLPGAYHTKYIVTIARCRGMHLINPTAYAGGSIDNFDSQVGIQSGQTVDATECVWEAISMRDQAFSKLLTNSGTGTPSYRFTVMTTPVKIFTPGNTEFRVTSGASSLTVASTGITVPGTCQVDGNATIGSTTAATHTMRGQITTSAPSGGTGLQTSNTATGQTAGSVIWRLTSTGSYDTTGGAIFPVACTISDTTTRSAGASSVGKTGLSIDCSTGTGVSATALTTARGNNDFNTGASSTTYFRKSIKYLGKATTSALSSNTNNLSGATDLVRWYLNPTANIDLTGIVATEDGHRLTLYNPNAFIVTLKHLSGSSSAANQIICTNNADIPISQNTSVTLEYSTDSFTSGGKWIVIGGAGV